jgi:hypothetical protein
MRGETRRSAPEPRDVLIDGVVVHAELSRQASRTGTELILRSRDCAALERTATAVVTALRDDGWEEVPR